MRSPNTKPSDSIKTKKIQCHFYEVTQWEMYSLLKSVKLKKISIIIFMPQMEFCKIHSVGYLGVFALNYQSHISTSKKQAWGSSHYHLSPHVKPFSAWICNLRRVKAGHIGCDFSSHQYSRHEKMNLCWLIFKEIYCMAMSWGKMGKIWIFFINHLLIIIINC